MKVVLVLAITVACCFAQQQYPTRYDNIDVKGIINNRVLLPRYINCLLDKGRCDNEGATLKQFLPDALQTGCSKCSEKQKQNSREIVTFLVKNRPDDWKALLDKYDKDRKYENNYKRFYQ